MDLFADAERELAAAIGEPLQQPVRWRPVVASTGGRFVASEPTPDPARPVRDDLQAIVTWRSMMTAQERASLGNATLMLDFDRADFQLDNAGVLMLPRKGDRVDLLGEQEGGERAIEISRLVNDGGGRLLYAAQVAQQGAPIAEVTGFTEFEEADAEVANVVGEALEQKVIWRPMIRATGGQYVLKPPTPDLARPVRHLMAIVTWEPESAGPLRPGDPPPVIVADLVLDLELADFRNPDGSYAVPRDGDRFELPDELNPADRMVQAARVGEDSGARIIVACQVTR